MPAKKNKNKQTPEVNCVWALVSAMSSIDQRSNNVSLFNVIDQVNVPKPFFLNNSDVKAFPLRHEIVSLWRRVITANLYETPIKFSLEIALLDPSGKPIQRVVKELNIDPKFQRSRYTIEMNALPLTVPGDYLYRLSVGTEKTKDFQEVFVLPLQVCDI